jgi:hypothetical protein
LPSPNDSPTEGSSQAPAVAPYASPSPEIPTGGSGECDQTNEERAASILDAIIEISGEDWVFDTSSSRYQTTDWITNVDEAQLCGTATARIQQRYVAALLYFQLNGANWYNCRADIDGGGVCVQEDPNNENSTIPAIRFLAPVHECFWFGLACEAGTDLSVETEADLTVIELPANNLGGDLPDEVYSLTKLTKLIMDDNKNISGSISTLIGNLQDLIFFDLDHNNMDGSLPEELFTLTKLEALDLNSNQFTGALSPSIGNLSELVVLQIEDNLFSGDVPTDGLLALEKLGTCACNQAMLYQGFEII